MSYTERALQMKICRRIVALLASAFFLLGCNFAKPITAGTIDAWNVAGLAVPESFAVAYTITEAQVGDSEKLQEQALGRNGALRSAAGKVLGRYFPIASPLIATSEQNAVIAIRGRWSKGTRGDGDSRVFKTTVDVELLANNGKQIASASGSAIEKFSDQHSENVALNNSCILAIKKALDSIFHKMRPEADWMKRLPRGQFKPQNVSNAGAIALYPISSSGTGFFVNGEGDIATAKHVVEECPAISVVYKDVEFPVSVRFSDDEWDLAIVHADLKPVSFAELAPAEDLKTGKDVIAFGFPLQGLLAPTPSLTTGILSNDQVIKGKNDVLQITTPIQPGNSGGPLLGNNGATYGVIVSTLNALKLAIETGALPQNVNFAISSVRLSLFLSAKSVPWTAAEARSELTAVEIAEQAKEYTVIVLCRGGMKR